MMLGLYDYMTAFQACAGSVFFVGIKSGVQEASAWPVVVRSVTNAAIGNAGDKEEFINLWNANVDNQAVGVLRGTYGPFGCELHLKCDVDISIVSNIFYVPTQTIGRVQLQFANGQTTIVPMVKLAEFTVGAAGAPMVDGDTDFTHSYLANHRCLVLISGVAPPIDTTGSGTGMSEFGIWVQKTDASDTLTIVPSVYDGQNIQIYAF